MARQKVSKSGRRLAECEKERDELRERIKYITADFENYKKHIDREKDAFEKAANERLIKSLLQTVDDLERSLKGISDRETRKGIKMVYDNLMKTLRESGLKRIEAVGKMFDPYYHDAMMSKKSRDEDGTILEELLPGYMLNSKVIRHSKVIIAKS
ncbi:MAG: nucleotide exchange factor GrpE [Candidatus Aenigmarchaeota archaeon]|nr:nucleotide exchange factor GrpE [Candidatus Aenigmarchaeota archaeon]